MAKEKKVSLFDDFGAIDDPDDFGAIDDVKDDGLDDIINPLERNLKAQQEAQAANVIAQKSAEAKRVQEQNNPENWTLEQTKRHFKNNPPKTVSEEAFASALIKQKQNKIKDIEEKVLGEDTPQLKQAPPDNIFGKLRKGVENVLGSANFIESPEFRQAKAMNVLAIAQRHNLDPAEVEKNYENYALNPEFTGIRPEFGTSLPEEGGGPLRDIEAVVNKTITPVVVGGLAMHPEVTIPALAVFGVLDYLVPTAEKLKEIDETKLTPEAKAGIRLLDLAVKGGLSGVAIGKGGSVLRQKSPEFRALSDKWFRLFGKEPPAVQAEKPVAGKPTAVEPKVEKPVAAEPVIEKPVVPEPVIEPARPKPEPEVLKPGEVDVVPDRGKYNEIIGRELGKIESERAVSGRKPTEDEVYAEEFVKNRPAEMSNNYDAQIKEEYKTDYKRIVSSDSAKFAIPGMGVKQSVSYHEASSAFAKYKFDQFLSNSDTAGKPVMFTAGVSGAGKSHSIRSNFSDKGLLDEFALVYDTNLNNLKSFETKYNQVKEANDWNDFARATRVFYVYRDPIDAYVNGVIPRAGRSKRIVSIDAHIDNIGSVKTIKEIAAKYPEVGITIELSDGKSLRPGTLDALPDIVYNKNEIRSLLVEEVKQAYDNGKISKELYEQAVKRSPAGKPKEGGRPDEKILAERGEELQPDAVLRERPGQPAAEPAAVTPQAKTALEKESLKYNSPEEFIRDNVIEASSEDFLLNTDKVKSVVGPAFIVDGKVIGYRYGEKGIMNHSDIAERNNFFEGKNALPGFIDKEGKFKYQSPDDIQAEFTRAWEEAHGASELPRNVIRNQSSLKVAEDLSDYVSELQGPQTLLSYGGEYSRASDWPSFLSNRGYTKKQLLNILDKFRSGAALTKNQQDIINYVVPEFARQIQVEIPETAGKRRKFIQTVKSAEKTAPEVARKIESLYEPISNKETLAQAQEFVKNNYNEAIEMALGTKRPTAFSNAVSIVLIDKAQAEGRFAEAVSLVEKTAEKQTELGQAIQALSMYARLSPEGVLMYAGKVMRKARESVPRQKLTQFERMSKNLSEQDKDKLAKKLGVPHISEIMAQELRRLAKQIKDMPEGREKQIKTALLLKRISDLVPKDIGTKVSLIQTMAQLLNPKTLIRNLLGNLGFQVLEGVSDTAALALDVAASLRTGKRTVFLPNMKVQVGGLITGLKEGTQEALLGINLREQTTKFTLPKNGVFDKGVLSALEKTLRISLGATDRAFYQAAYNQSMRDQMLAAKRAGIALKEPTEEMIERAHLLGLYRTFQDDNVLSNQFVRLKRWFNVGKSFGIGDIVLKYPKTPANLMARGIEYSPFGFAQTVYELAKPLLGKSFDQEHFVRSTSRALVGSATLVGTGALLAELGIISGRRAKDRDVVATRESVGIREYQINVSALKRFAMSGFEPDAAALREDDVLVTYDWFLPNSIGLALGANMVIDPDSSLVDRTINLGERMLQASETLQEQPLVRGVKVLTRKEDIGQGLSDTLKDIPASFVPTLLNQIRQTVDNTSRNTKDPNYFKEVYNKTILRIPGASSTLPPKITSLGEEKQMYQLGSNNPFNVFLNPAFVNLYKPDPVSKMVLDIWEMSGETVQFPRVAAGKIKLGSDTPEPITLTPAQYTQYQRYVGHKTDVLFSLLAEDERFLGLPDDIKAKTLAGFLTDINTAAKIEIFGYRPQKVSQGVIGIIKHIGESKTNLDNDELDAVNEP